MDPFQLARVAWSWVWRRHFQIPEFVYWLVLVFAAGGVRAEITEPALLFGLPFVVSLAGILRWRQHRRRGQLALVVPLFSGGEGTRAKQVQDVILTGLYDKLPPEQLALIHAVPTSVGTHQRRFAVALRRRLRAQFLLHGRIDERSDGTYGVFARVAQPADRSVTHHDWHTRDVTPATASWGALFHLLTPATNVAIEEYPLEFSTELEAVVRGTSGQLALAFGDDPRAEELLKSAISRAPASTSHQIDRLRADLATAVFRQGRHEEALDILRKRATGRDPSPHLLRKLFELLSPQRGSRTYEWSTADRDEAIAALRRAAAVDTDPQLDLTLYNLAQLLSHAEETRSEADRIRAVLLTSSRYYRRTWYLRKEIGATHWDRAERANEAGDSKVAAIEYRAAARWYSKALRARPRIRFFYFEGPNVVPVRKFRQSATLLANAWDAHRKAKHRVRAMWYGWRTHREQQRLEKLGLRYFAREDWHAAYAYFDWMLVGYHDLIESAARVYKAVCMQQLGLFDEAGDEWRTALDDDPLALLIRAAMLDRPEPPVLPNGLPGSEPTDIPTVVKRLNQVGALEQGESP